MTHSKSIQKYVKQIPAYSRIWRFLTLEKLVWLLCSKSVYFCQIKRFSDTDEGKIPPFFGGMLEGSDLYNKNKEIEDAPNFWRSYCGASCWHINDSLSQDMWDKYTEGIGGRGAAVQTTVGNLQKCIGDMTEYGQVEYGAVNYTGKLPSPPPGDPNGMGLDVVMFHKMPDFSWENEYRAILYAVSDHPRSMNMMNHHGGLNVAVNLETLLEKLYLPIDQPAITKHFINGLVESAGLSSKVEYI
jgi:hypothetical protein